jgi:hypothetical protein
MAGVTVLDSRFYFYGKPPASDGTHLIHRRAPTRGLSASHTFQVDSFRRDILPADSKRPKHLTGNFEKASWAQVFRA